MTRLASLFLPVFILLCATAFPLDPRTALTQFSHDVWQLKEGLPQSTVAAMIQSQDGYIWMGTHEGLVRFDGVRFTVFDKRNTKEIIGNDVYSLFEARDGTMWFGVYGGGLHSYKDGKFVSYLGKSQETGEVITAFAEDARGGLWIGMDAGRLAYYKDGQFTAYGKKIGLKGDIVRALCFDRGGALWVGTSSNGLFRYHNGESTEFNVTKGLSHNNVWALLQDRQNNLWIGTEGGGLDRFRDGVFQHFSMQNGLSSTNVWALQEDRAGNIWIGTRGGGLQRYSGGVFSTFSREEGLSDTSVRSILEDKEGSLWIGTDAGGLNRLKEGKFLTYTTKEGLSDDSTWSVFEGKDGSLWIGTRNGGLNRFHNGKFEAFTTAEGLSNNTVRAVIEDRDGAVWMGTRGGGLNRLKDGRVSAYTTKDGLSNDIIWSLFEDREGGIWVGTDNGLNLFRDNKFTVYTTAEGLANNIILCITQDHKGNLWVGTDAGGLNAMQNGKVTARFSIKEGLAANSVISLYEDREGILWIGTWGGGLSRLQNGKITTYTMKSGLFDDVVFETLEDNKGNFWMSSNKGIFRVRRQQLEDFAAGKIGKIDSHSYGTADGMKSSECNGANYPAGSKTRDGKLWFPTVQGVTVIDPDHLPDNTMLPAVVVEEVLTDRGSLAYSKAGVSIEPGIEKIEFRYTALTFLAPERVFFRYKLDGFDRNWIDAGTRRIAYYTNIPPGQYRFRVIVRNSDGYWNETGASFPFHLKPRFTETIWFYSLCTLGLGLLLALGHRLRVRQLRDHELELVRLVEARTTDLKQEKEKTEAALRIAEEASRVAEEASLAKSHFLANMSHELRTPLNAIIGYSEILQEEAAEINEDLTPDIQRIRAAGKHLLSLINDILDLSKIEAGKMELRMEDFELAPLLRDVIATIEPMLAKNGNRLHQRTVGATGRIYSDPMRLRQILLNLMSNATKFTENGIIYFDVERSGGLVFFRIRDTGIGIKPEQLKRLFQPFEQADSSTSRKFGGTGLGLVISRRFCQMMGGDILAESEYGKGSTFTIWLTADSPVHARQLI